MSAEDRKAPVRADERVAAVLVAWNSMRWLPAALESLAAQSHPPETVVIVDNASTDGVDAFLARAYPSHRYVRNMKNEGFAAAMNQGIAIATSPWLLALNPDVVLDRDYLKRLLEAGGKIADAGALTGVLRRPDGSVDSSGIQLRRYLLRPIDDRTTPLGNGSTPLTVFGACAAAALYRRAMLEDIRHGSSYFDPEFFAYFEDVDLAWRAQHRGWKAYVVPDASAIHARGTSGGESSRAGRLRSQRNRYLALYKNLPGRRFLTDLVPILAVELYRMVRHPRTQAAGFLQSLRMRPRLRAWRAQIQKTATAAGSWYLRS